MRDPDTWMGLWPRETRDRLALASILIMAPTGFLFESLYVIPQFVPMFSTEYYVYSLVFLFLLLNFMGNLYRLITVDPSGRKSDLPSVLRPEWRYCYMCQLNSPPRAYHCPLCELCILKRDHHSSFAGTCVGYHNHRYYLVAVMYAWVGSALGLFWHWDLIWDGLGGFSLGTIWYCVMPHLALVTFQIGPFNFLMAGIQMSSVVCFGLSSYLMGMQAFHISRGQTQQEAWAGIRGNDMGIWMNVREVLGKNVVLAILFPFVPSPLPGNGLRFPKKVEVENVKDL